MYDCTLIEETEDEEDFELESAKRVVFTNEKGKCFWKEIE